MVQLYSRGFQPRPSVVRCTQQYSALVAILSVLLPLPPTRATSQLLPAQCDVEPVSRICCGPNASMVGNYCACKQYHGCELPCEALRACPTSVGFHINVPQRCDLRVKGAGSGFHGSAVTSPEQCITENRSIRFVHIDKSGGTAVRAWWNQFYPEPEFSNHFVYPTREGHHFTFGAGCVDDCYMFFVRDPVDRWLSRFIMRERDFARSPEQYERVRAVFEKYPTPNHLAEALSSSDPAVQEHAKRIFHSSDAGVPKKLSQYYLAALFDEQTRDDYMKRVIFVGETSSLADDFMSYIKKVGLPSRGTDHFEKLNAMPKEQSKNLHLSAAGLKNVEKELKQEYEILNILHIAGLIKSECTHHGNCGV